MKICFVLEHYYPHIGGGETLFKEYATRLGRAGCEVKVVTSNSGGLEGTYQRDGVETRYCRWPAMFGHPVPKRNDLLEAARWSDVVHAATYTAAPAALSVARDANRPCIVTVYEALGEKWFWVERNFLKALAFCAFERFVLEKSYSMFHAISFATRNDLVKLGIPDRLIATIHPGIGEGFLRCSRPADEDRGASVTTEPEEKIFLYFGRPGKTKGVFVLLDAIRRIKVGLPQNLRFRFILGSEPRSEAVRFKRSVERYELGHIVEIVDPMPEELLIDAIREAFCVVVPSITEGFGYTAAESCALGKPVIASDAGSLPEVVSGRALFFQNRNSVDLSEKILRAARGDFVTVAEKRFDWEDSTQQLLRIYEALAERSRQAQLASSW